MMRGLPCPLQRGQHTSRKAKRMDTSVGRLHAQVVHSALNAKLFPKG